MPRLAYRGSAPGSSVQGARWTVSVGQPARLHRARHATIETHLSQGLLLKWSRRAIMHDGPELRRRLLAKRTKEVCDERARTGKY